MAVAESSRMELASKVNSFFKLIFSRNIDISDFNKRLVLQKLVFLAKKTGKFGDFNAYNFNLYLHGPYSPDLSFVSYWAKEHEEELNDVEFGDAEKALIKAIKSNFSKELGELDSNMFELYGAIVYAKKELQLDDEAIVGFIKEKKSWYSEEEVKNAITKMRNFWIDLRDSQN